MEPKISVVVPVYNVENYLDKCVSSLLNQNYDSYEVILVDDGSPDNCPDMCEEYEKRDQIVKCFHKNNGGLGDARNYGVQKSRGEYIVFVDSDDYVEKSYLSNLWNLQLKYNADLCITKIKRENLNDLRKPETAGNTYSMSGSNAVFEVYKHEGLGWSACGKLFRKDILLKNPFPKGYYEDSAVMYKILDGCKVVAVGNYLYNYHYINHEGSILQSSLNEKHFRIFDICDEFERYILKRYPHYMTLTVIFKRAAITQMLNCQVMCWKEYKQIFNKYKLVFRKNWISIIRDKRFSKTNKIYLTLYCTFPALVKVIEKYR